MLNIGVIGYGGRARGMIESMDMYGIRSGIMSALTCLCARQSADTRQFVEVKYGPWFARLEGGRPRPSPRLWQSSRTVPVRPRQRAGRSKIADCDLRARRQGVCRVHAETESLPLTARHAMLSACVDIAARRQYLTSLCFEGFTFSRQLAEHTVQIGARREGRT